MNRLTQSVLITLMGGVLVAVTASGRFTSYVKPGFGILLMSGGIVLILTGIVSLTVAIRRDAPTAGNDASADHEHDHLHPAPTRDGPAVSGDDGRGDNGPSLSGDDGHGHSSSRAPWLILAPILVLLLAPPALGADAVARTSGSQALAGLAPTPATPPGGVSGDGGYVPNDGSGSAGSSISANGQTVRTLDFPAMPAGTDPALSLKEFVLRALYDQGGSVTRNPVTLTGFIAPAGEGFSDGYTVARLVISCCAADAHAIQLHAPGPTPFPVNTWVDAIVTAVPGSGTMANDYVPTLHIASITKIAQPADPYEH